MQAGHNEHLMWKAATNGGGARPWFVWRHNAIDPPGIYSGMLIACDPRGYYRRFGSLETAQRLADKLNGKHQ